MFDSYRNVQNALPDVLRDILEEGGTDQSRVGETKELLAARIQLKCPWERFHAIPARKANPFAQLAETLWVLSGNNEIEWLKFYLPRAGDFSDDGFHWRAGYGPRLRAWSYMDAEGDPDYTDQISWVVETLRDNPTTRRAVVSLWDPGLDHEQHTLDIPCNNWLQFLVRDGELHMNVVARSNDVMWGWSGINTFEWSVLQEIVAYSLGVRVGFATYFIGSLHLYERHYAKAQQIVDNPHVPFSPYEGNIARQPDWEIEWDEMSNWLDRLFYIQEAEIRRDPQRCAQLTLDSSHIESDILRMLDAYARFKDGAPRAEVMRRLERVTRDDMRRAGIEYMARELPKRVEPIQRPIVELAVQLQAAKARTYGDSWKKYGEKGSIFPNIARKFDRIEHILSNDEMDVSGETLLDTIVDLGVYAGLYASWRAECTFEEALASAFHQDNEQFVFDTDYKFGTICRAFHSIAFMLGMEESEPDEAFHSTLYAAMVLARTALEWANTFRVSKPNDWAKFVQSVVEMTTPVDTRLEPDLEGSTW